MDCVRIAGLFIKKMVGEELVRVGETERSGGGGSLMVFILLVFCQSR